MTELVIPTVLVAAIVAITALAKRIGVLSPILLVVAGIGLSYLPDFPDIVLDPDLVIAGVLPPLIYIAAIETSVRAFRRNLRPILLLAIGLVLATAAAVGLVLHALVPQIPLSVAFALGAVVSPPDAIAATAVARRVGLPRRMVTILEGESLINDATALVTLRIAVSAALGHTVSALDFAWDFGLAAVGGLLIGGVAAVAVAWLHRWAKDPLFDNAISLLTPFAVFTAAELIEASGVVAVVVGGLYLGQRWPVLMSPASRLQMEAFWRMVRFLLEGGAFLLIGLQLQDIVRGLRFPQGTVVVATVGVVATVLLVRFLWVLPATYLARLMPGRDAPPIGYPIVIAWAGMRGVVTLAAAFSLPLATEDGHPFIDRGLLLWLAFAVIVATLLVQGPTLPWVIRTVGIPPDDPKEDLLREAEVQQEATRAALTRLDEEAGSAPQDVVDRLRQQAEYRARHVWEQLGSQQRETPAAAYRRLRRAMLQAERDVFRKARDNGRVPEEVLVRVQRDMDLEESILTRE